MYSPWAIPNDPRMALSNMDAVFPQKGETVMARKQRCSKCNKLSDPYDWSLVRHAGSTVARRECPKCVAEAKKEKGTLVVSD